MSLRASTIGISGLSLWDRRDNRVSATSVLYPHSEGTLRSFLRAADATSAPTAKTLSKVAVERHQTSRISNSLLLPAKFQQYLDDVYFAHFAPGTSPDVF